MSKVDVGSVGATGMPAPSSSTPVTSSSAPTNLTLTLDSSEWQPNVDPVSQFPDDSIFECFTNAAGALRNAYTMNIHTAYSFDVEDRLFSNQSAIAFELQGVLFSQGSQSQGFTNEPLKAAFDGSLTSPASWRAADRQRCVQVTWRFNVAPSLRHGTFQIDSSPPDTGLFVRSAALIVIGESTSRIDTLSDASTSATGLAASSSSNATVQSSSPNLGVIIPAILVPVIVIAGAIVAFVFWRNRQQRRRRLAPSAAFRQDHAATIARGVEGGGRGASPVPSNAAAYIPLDEKRAFNFST